MGIDPFNHKPNTAFEALLHGYVVLCAGIRGRNTGMNSQEFFVGGSGKENTGKEEKLTGRAPAIIVDMKAAIRYMRYNADVIPGDVEKIITNGTSAGGALSALAGASGNAKEYESYLKAIGAADERVISLLQAVIVRSIILKMQMLRMNGSFRKNPYFI